MLSIFLTVSLLVLGAMKGMKSGMAWRCRAPQAFEGILARVNPAPTPSLALTEAWEISAYTALPLKTPVELSPLRLSCLFV
jgi:hypothetical protein